MPKDPTTGKRREATLVERVKVIEKHAAGKSYRAIGEEIGISKSEAQRIIQRWKEFEELKPRPRTGRPSKYPAGETRAERRRKDRLAKKLADAENVMAGVGGEVEGSAVGVGNSMLVPIVSLTVDGQDSHNDVPILGSAVSTGEGIREDESPNAGEGNGGEANDVLVPVMEDGATDPRAESEGITNQNSPTESAQ